MAGRVVGLEIVEVEAGRPAALVGPALMGIALGPRQAHLPAGAATRCAADTALVGAVVGAYAELAGEVGPIRVLGCVAHLVAPLGVGLAGQTQAHVVAHEDAVQAAKQWFGQEDHRVTSDGAVIPDDRAVSYLGRCGHVDAQRAQPGCQGLEAFIAVARADQLPGRAGIDPLAQAGMRPFAAVLRPAAVDRRVEVVFGRQAGAIGMHKVGQRAIVGVAVNPDHCGVAGQAVVQRPRRAGQAVARRCLLHGRIDQETFNAGVPPAPVGRDDKAQHGRLHLACGTLELQAGRQAHFRGRGGGQQRPSLQRRHQPTAQPGLLAVGIDHIDGRRAVAAGQDTGDGAWRTARHQKDGQPALLGVDMAHQPRHVDEVGCRLLSADHGVRCH